MIVFIICILLSCYLFYLYYYDYCISYMYIIIMSGEPNKAPRRCREIFAAGSWRCSATNAPPLLFVLARAILVAAPLNLLFFVI